MTKKILVLRFQIFYNLSVKIQTHGDKLTPKWITFNFTRLKWITFNFTRLYCRQFLKILQGRKKIYVRQ